MEGQIFGAGEIFTMMFVMLGPLKLIGPFAQQTRELDEAQVRRIAFTVFAIALVAAIVGSMVGRQLLIAWHISTPALVLAAAIVLFLVALRLVLQQYQAPPALEPLPADPTAAAIRLVFPLVLTPYGLAALIALFASSGAAGERWLIFALLTAVMVLNLAAMLLSRQVMRGMILLVLHVLGAVLGVLQVGLAVQMIIRQLGVLGVLVVKG